MAIYVTKKCPHCGDTYQLLQSGEQRIYGCPYKTCTKCGKSFWDTDIVEPALHGYINAYEKKQAYSRALTSVFYGALGIAAIIFGIWVLSLGNNDGEMLLFSLASIALGCGLLWIIFGHLKSKQYDREHSDEISADQRIDYDASWQRLQNTEYLTALARHDARAEILLAERLNGQKEHYADRP